MTENFFKLQIVPNDQRKCRKCGELKIENEFAKTNKSVRCKICTRAYRNERYKRADVKVKERGQFLKAYFKRKYGITYEEYQDMFLKQNGKCAICGKEKDYHDFRSSKRINLSVDHCHATGKVRGLLCISCNNGLGNFRDNLELFQKAVEYLKINK